VIEIDFPDRGVIQIEHLVCDVNGTLALDGQLIEGVSQAFSRLSQRLQIHLVTADTHGAQAAIDRQLGITAERLSPGNEAEQKAAFVRRLGPAQVAAIGQGANDSLMLKEAALGICIVSPEGTAVATLLNADIVIPDILAALDLFEKPKRLIATLRK
jgi:P-type E1-E2 ATPase